MPHRHSINVNTCVAASFLTQNTVKSNDDKLFLIFFVGLRWFRWLFPKNKICCMSNKHSHVCAWKIYCERSSFHQFNFFIGMWGPSSKIIDKVSTLTSSYVVDLHTCVKRHYHGQIFTPLVSYHRSMDLPRLIQKNDLKSIILETFLKYGDVQSSTWLDIFRHRRRLFFLLEYWPFIFSLLLFVFITLVAISSVWERKLFLDKQK